MKRITSSIALGLLALTLTACSVTVVFDPPTEPVSATSPSANPTAVASGTLSAGSTAWYDVSVSSQRAAEGDVVYLEVDAGRDATTDAGDVLRVRVYTSSGSVTATSDSPDGFASGSVAPTAAAGLEPQAISVTYGCFGSCVILPAQAGNYIVRVTNLSSSSVSYDFYAYMNDEQDTGENVNDGSPGVGLSSFDSGAIETIGDEDYYEILAGGQLFFDSASALDLRADVIEGSTVVATLQPGDPSFRVVTGDEVVVYALSGQAGAPAASNYSLEIQ